MLHEKSSFISQLTSCFSFSSFSKDSWWDDTCKTIQYFACYLVSLSSSCFLLSCVGAPCRPVPSSSSSSHQAAALFKPCISPKLLFCSCLLSLTEPQVLHPVVSCCLSRPATSSSICLVWMAVVPVQLPASLRPSAFSFSPPLLCQLCKFLQWITLKPQLLPSLPSAPWAQ